MSAKKCKRVRKWLKRKHVSVVASDEWRVPNWEESVYTAGIFVREWQTKDLQHTELGRVYRKWEMEAGGQRIGKERGTKRQIARDLPVRSRVERKITTHVNTKR